MTRDEMEQLLSDISRRLRDVFQPSMIYLYGSWAYGKPRDESDVDLLVVVPDSSLHFFDRGALAYKALRGIDLSIDVQVYTRDEFEQRADLPISFERTVRSKGRVLYAA